MGTRGDDPPSAYAVPIPIRADASAEGAGVASPGRDCDKVEGATRGEGGAELALCEMDGDGGAGAARIADEEKAGVGEAERELTDLAGPSDAGI